MAEFSGHLKLRAEARENGQTVLAGQSFRAPFHVGKAYWDEEGRALRVQVVNPTAGILEGDKLEMDISVAKGAALLVTTPSASRVFHMRVGEAVASQTFSVEAGGWLEFLPEPLVPHNASSYRQTTEIDVEVGGEVVFADFLTPGRIARGEMWAWSRLKLELTLRIGGNLIFRERLDQSGEELRSLADLAGMKQAQMRVDETGACCFGNMVLVSPTLDEATDWSAALAGLHAADAWVGLSALRGKCGAWSLKVIAADSVVMRRVMAEVRRILGQRLPRMCVALRRV
jgi:urease accessory protein